MPEALAADRLGPQLAQPPRSSLPRSRRRCGPAGITPGHPLAAASTTVRSGSGATPGPDPPTGPTTRSRGGRGDQRGAHAHRGMGAAGRLPGSEGTPRSLARPGRALGRRVLRASARVVPSSPPRQIHAAGELRPATGGPRCAMHRVRVREAKRAREPVHRIACTGRPEPKGTGQGPLPPSDSGFAGWSGTSRGHARPQRRVARTAGSPARSTCAPPIALAAACAPPAAWSDRGTACADGRARRGQGLSGADQTARRSRPRSTPLRVSSGVSVIVDGPLAPRRPGVRRPVARG